MLKLLSFLLIASCATACTNRTSDSVFQPTTISVKIAPPSLGGAVSRHVTSSPPGIDCTSDGTTTTGTCETTVTGPNIVILDPHSDGIVVWSDDSGMMIWAGTEDAGKSANWATIDVDCCTAARHTFTVAYP
jgi:hypothetical protein